MASLVVVPTGPHWVGQLLAAGQGPPVHEKNTTQMLVSLGVAAVVIAAVCAGLLLSHWLIRKRRRYSHAGLFAGLCKAHALDRSSRRLLRQVARLCQLTHPARVFTESRWLVEAARNPAMKPRATELVAVCRRLFGAPGDEAAHT